MLHTGPVNTITVTIRLVNKINLIYCFVFHHFAALRFPRYFCPLASQCEVTSPLSRENPAQSEVCRAKEFQRSTSGLFLQPSVARPSLAQPAQASLAPVKPTEHFRKGPSLQMVRFLPARGSEGSGCWPRTTTSDRPKPLPLRKPAQSIFSGAFSPSLGAQRGPRQLVWTRKECIHGRKRPTFEPADTFFPNRHTLATQDTEWEQCFM